MVFINTATRQITAKVVYYGPGLSGKTTNLEWIYKHTDARTRGEMVSLETETDRTLFFDLLPLEVGVIGGFRTRFQLYTVPGQVFYNSTRKLVLRGVDGIVFVADSQQTMMAKNIESLQNLYDNLQEIGIDPTEIPMVFQYNKRDLKNLSSVEELNQQLNPNQAPYFEAVAIEGVGVFETLKAIARLTLASIRRKAMVAPMQAQPVPPVSEGQMPPTVISTTPSPTPATSGGGPGSVISATPTAGPLTVRVDEIPERVEFARVETPSVEKTPIRMKKVSLRSIEDIEQELHRIRREVATSQASTRNVPQPRVNAPGSGTVGEKGDVLGTMAKFAEDALSDVLTPRKVREVRKHIRVRMSREEFERAQQVGLDLHVIGAELQRHFRRVLVTKLTEQGEVKKVIITLEIDLIPKK